VKITGIKIYRHTIRYKSVFPGGERSVAPRDIYGGFDASSWVRMIEEKLDEATERDTEAMFLFVTTDEGITGVHGPIEYRAELLTAAETLAPVIEGRDPLDNRMLWDMMLRCERHARSGITLMAIGAVDIALWDLKGKILGKPVYKLIGGGREKLRPYASALGFSVEPRQAAKQAISIKRMGIGAQKWFFRHGPDDGPAGIEKNLELAYSLRETLGDDYTLMFDCWMGWTVPYAETMLRGLERVRPMWVEEALRPHYIEAWKLLKSSASVPLSAGEHLYTRFEVNAYLREGIFSVMQSDPDWCGGITEALRIADLCELYGTLFIPHGHSLHPAMHVVASMPPDVCPYVEYLLSSMHRKSSFFKAKPLSKDGYLYLGEEPGLGYEFDMERITRTVEIKFT